MQLCKPPVFTLIGYSVIGFAMYYFTYDPWIGKLLYLEDFYVMREYRGKGVIKGVSYETAGISSILLTNFILHRFWNWV